MTPDTESLLDRIAHGATDQDDAEAVRRIIEERNVYARMQRPRRCAECKGSGTVCRGGDRYIPCEACNGKGF